jgi:hypothetical protein
VICTGKLLLPRLEESLQKIQNEVSLLRTEQNVFKESVCSLSGTLSVLPSVSTKSQALL